MPQASTASPDAVVGISSGIGPPPEIDARNLARLAEWVDGLRGHRLVVVRENGAWNARAEQPGDEEKAVLKAHKAFDVPERGQMKSKVTIRGRPLSEDFDALFWTESAIQKFLLLYYDVHPILTAEEHQVLLEAYKRKDLIGIGHVAPSQGRPLYKDALEAMRVFAKQDVVGVDGGISSMVVEMGVREFVAQGAPS